MNTKQKTLLGLGVVALALLFVLAYLYIPKTNETAVARINNQITITDSQLEERVNRVLKNISLQGLETDQEQINQIRNQTLESLINEKLILNYAEKNNLEVLEEELDKEYNAVVFFYGGEENLKSQLQTFEMSEEEFRKNLRTNVLFKKGIENFSSLELNATEEELLDIYANLKEEALKSGLESELPSFEESRPWLEHELKEQKILSESNNFLSHLHSGAEIEIL